MIEHDVVSKIRENNFHKIDITGCHYPKTDVFILFYEKIPGIQDYKTEIIFEKRE